MQYEYVERGCRKGVQRGARDKVQSWSVERECQRGAGQLTMLSMQREDVERGCRKEVEMKLKVGHWSVERKCQRPAVCRKLEEINCRILTEQ